jgi:GNAT superfamily N-acetyltransferase
VTRTCAVASAKPLSKETFGDLERLFSEPGCSFARGCWCMEYRIGRKAPPGNTAAVYRKHELRRLAVKSLTGLIGYDRNGAPIGWVALGPRSDFPPLQRSPVMRPVDDAEAWVTPCFVVPTAQRQKGVASAMLGLAVECARGQGAHVLEGFPFDRPGRSQPQWLWHGAMSMFTRLGFVEVARRKPARPVMRLRLDGRRPHQVREGEGPHIIHGEVTEGQRR